MMIEPTDSMNKAVGEAWGGGDHPYSAMVLDDENNIPDLRKWVEEGALEGLVEEPSGGIIGYIHHYHADRIAALLNVAALAIQKEKQHGPEPCEACKGQRWLIFVVSGSMYYPDGAYVVQKCDECGKLPSDDAAVVEAHGAGLNCDDSGRVRKREVKRWMRLYPDRGIKPGLGLVIAEQKRKQIKGVMNEP